MHQGTVEDRHHGESGNDGDADQRGGNSSAELQSAAASEAASEERAASPASVAVVGGTAPARPRRRRVAGRQRRGDGEVAAPEAGSGATTGGSAPRAPEENVGSETSGTVDDSRVAIAHQPRSRGVRRSTAVALVAATMVCAVAAVGFGLAWANLQAQQTANGQITAVARAFVLDLTNLTPKTVDARIGDLLAASTGQFEAQARSFFSGGIRQELEKAQPVEQGQVRSLDVESHQGTNASVFAVVDDSYVNPALEASGQGRQSDVLRLDLGLTQTPQGWKVATVTVLDGPSGGVLSTPGSTSTGSSTAAGSAAAGSAAAGSGASG